MCKGLIFRAALSRANSAAPPHEDYVPLFWLNIALRRTPLHPAGELCREAFPISSKRRLVNFNGGETDEFYGEQDRHLPHDVDFEHSLDA